MEKKKSIDVFAEISSEAAEVKSDTRVALSFLRHLSVQRLRLLQGHV